jgi:hypothetical protein
MRACTAPSSSATAILRVVVERPAVYTRDVDEVRERRSTGVGELRQNAKRLKKRINFGTAFPEFAL